MTNLQGDVIGLLDSSGSFVASYTYDAWGNPLSSTGSLASTIGTLNPLRYRGYVYDSETGFYYLQSRYYDPQTGRFINADGYVSTGQGIMGNNMFAYCANNPVNLIDPTGNLWQLLPLLIIPIILSACSNQSEGQGIALANAPDLVVGSAGFERYNCYGNALNKEIVADPSNYCPGDSVESVFAAVQADIGAENIRRLNSPNDPIFENEYMVALRCGPNDYHFIRRDSYGWFNKSGTLLEGIYVSESYIAGEIWYCTGIEMGNLITNHLLYYDSEPIFFAVKKEWDD